MGEEKIIEDEDEEKIVEDEEEEKIVEEEKEENNENIIDEIENIIEKSGIFDNTPEEEVKKEIKKVKKGKLLLAITKVEQKIKKQLSKSKRSIEKCFEKVQNEIKNMKNLKKLMKK